MRSFSVIFSLIPYYRPAIVAGALRFSPHALNAASPLPHRFLIFFGRRRHQRDRLQRRSERLRANFRAASAHNSATRGFSKATIARHCQHNNHNQPPLPIEAIPRWRCKRLRIYFPAYIFWRPCSPPLFGTHFCRIQKPFRRTGPGSLTSAEAGRWRFNL